MKKTRRLVSLLMALCMTICMIPTTALPVFATGDIDFDVSSDAPDDAGWEWDANTRTLSLFGVAAPMISNLPAGATINLLGKNTVRGIQADGSVTIEGSGVLLLNGASTIGGALTIKSGYVNTTTQAPITASALAISGGFLNAGGALNISSYDQSGGYTRLTQKITTGSVYINNGYLEAGGGISTTGNFTNDGGVVKASTLSLEAAIIAGGDLTFSKGVTIAIGAAGNAALEATGNINNSNDEQFFDNTVGNVSAIVPAAGKTLKDALGGIGYIVVAKQAFAPTTGLTASQFTGSGKEGTLDSVYISTAGGAALTIPSDYVMTVSGGSYLSSSATFALNAQENAPFSGSSTLVADGGIQTATSESCRHLIGVVNGDRTGVYFARTAPAANLNIVGYSTGGVGIQFSTQGATFGSNSLITGVGSSSGISVTGNPSDTLNMDNSTITGFAFGAGTGFSFSGNLNLVTSTSLTGATNTGAGISANTLDVESAAAKIAGGGTSSAFSVNTITLSAAGIFGLSSELANPTSYGVNSEISSLTRFPMGYIAKYDANIPSLIIGPQVGEPKSQEGGEATYQMTPDNLGSLANATATITWYTSPTGSETTQDGYVPKGINEPGNIDFGSDSGFTLLTLKTTEETADGTYYFKVTIKGSDAEATSSICSLVVGVGSGQQGGTTTISGLTAASNLVYNGKPQNGYVSTPTAGGKELVYSYTGTGSTKYGPTSTPPTNAGTYRLRVTVKDNENIWAEITFTIAKKQLEWDVSDLSAVKKEGVSGEVTVYGALAVTGFVDSTTVKVTVPGELTTSGLSNALREDTYQVTVRGSWTVTPNKLDNYELPAGSPTIQAVVNGVIELPLPPEVNEDYRLEMTYGLNGIPERLERSYDTEEDIIAAMLEDLSKEYGTLYRRNAELYDISLVYAEDGTPVDAEDFPKEGITVTIPYPRGASARTHEFFVAHMFTQNSTALRMSAGRVELPVVTKVEEGVQVTLHGFSPVLLAWRVNYGDWGGWDSYNDRWYYQDDDGNLATGWEKINGTWYYFDDSGIRFDDGWLLYLGDWYYLGSNGKMVTGWLYLDYRWYYMDPDGAMVSDGWRWIEGKWYYMEASGAMTTGWQYVNNRWYYLDKSGAMVNGWRWVSGIWYYFDSTGAMVSDGWYWIDGKCYYFYESGEMAANIEIDGYRIGYNGAWIQ